MLSSKPVLPMISVCALCARVYVRVDRVVCDCVHEHKTRLLASTMFKKDTISTTTAKAKATTKKLKFLL